MRNRRRENRGKREAKEAGTARDGGRKDQENRQVNEESIRRNELPPAWTKNNWGMKIEKIRRKEKERKNDK